MVIELGLAMITNEEQLTKHFDMVALLTVAQ